MKRWKNMSLLGLSFLVLGSAVAGCESDDAVKQAAEFYDLCDDTCEGEYECINGVCTLPCEVESDCDDTPVASACRTRFGVGSCEAGCEGTRGFSENGEGCEQFGEEFVCWGSACHPKDWVGPPEVGPPGIDLGVAGYDWTVIIKESEFSCVIPYHEGSVCDLFEVYNPGEDDRGCSLPGRLELALEADKEALGNHLESPSSGSELCLDLDCSNLKACVVERLTPENGGEPCLTEEGTSTYFQTGYCFLTRDNPEVNQSLRSTCVEPDFYRGLGGATYNRTGNPVVRVVGEGLPRPGGRLVYMCGGTRPL